MAKPKTIQFSILNIKIHPHSPDLYYQLLKKTFRSKIIRKIRGSDYGMVGSFRENYFDDNKLIVGDIYKFLSIDPTQKYLDIDSFKPIDPSESGEDFPIPENLKPNLKQIGYVFSVERHRLFFESSETAPNTVLKLMKNLFSAPEIVDTFGEVDCHVEATDEAIQKILSIPSLLKLQLSFTRPNPDDLPDTIKGRISTRLEKQKIRKFKQEFSTKDKDGMSLDEETTAWMEIAKSNGNVRAVGYDGEEKIDYSTTKHPVKERIKYDPDIETKLDSMVGLSLELLKKRFK